MTEYDPSFIPRVRDLGYLGATDTEIAVLLGVSTTTLRGWYERYPQFAMAWDDGKLQASAKVAAALYKRAVGYEYTKWKKGPNGMTTEKVHVEPNVQACVTWLTNKRPDQWKNKIDHESGGQPLPDAFNEVEAARRIAFALAKAMYLETGGSEQNGESSESKAEQSYARIASDDDSR